MTTAANKRFILIGILAFQGALADDDKVIENVELRPPASMDSETGRVEVGDLALEEPVRCVSHARLRSTEILGDQYIVFRLSHKETYVNVLDKKCNSLRPRRKLLLKPQGLQICRLDRVTVLTDDALGSANVLSRGISIPLAGFSDVGSCGLGFFSKMSDAGLVVLKEQIETEKKLEKSRRKAERNRRKQQRKSRREK